MVERNAARHAVGARDEHFREAAVGFVEARHLPHFKLHFPVFAELAHLRDRSGLGAEAVATVHEHDAFGLADEVERPVERGVAAAENDDVLPFEDRRILAGVVELLPFELFDALHLEGARLEGTHARGDDHDLGVKARARARFHIEAAVLLLFHARHFLTEVEDRVEGVDLLEEVFRELVGRVDGNGGNVVDGLGRIEFHALTADAAKRVDDVRLDFQKTEFEDLEETHRAGADDYGVRFNDLVRLFGQSQIVFNSHREKGFHRRNPYARPS